MVNLGSSPVCAICRLGAVRLAVQGGAPLKALWLVPLVVLALPARADQWIAIGVTPNPTSILFYDKTELRWTSKTKFRVWIEIIAQAELDKVVAQLTQKETAQIGQLVGTYQSPDILLVDKTLTWIRFLRRRHTNL